MPPDCSSAQFNYIMKELDEVINKMPVPSPEIHIMGDFNFPFLKWNTKTGVNIPTIVSGGTIDEQSQAKCLLQFAESNMLSQIISKPTRNKTYWISVLQTTQRRIMKLA